MTSISNYLKISVLSLITMLIVNTAGAKAVLDAMTKSLLGENESLKTYGIAISQAEVQTKAFEMTGKTQASQLTKQEKGKKTTSNSYST